MKKLSLILVFALTVCLLASCAQTPDQLYMKGNMAMSALPAEMTESYSITSDMPELEEAFSEISRLLATKMTVDKDNFTIDQASGVKMILVDNTLYSSFGNEKVKVEVTEEDINKLLGTEEGEENIAVEHFETVTMVEEDGRYVVTYEDLYKSAEDIAEESIEDLFESIGLDGSVFELYYYKIIITYSDNKFESMETEASFEFVIPGASLDIVYNLKRDFNYEDLEIPEVPSDADKYEEISADEFFER